MPKCLLKAVADVRPIFGEWPLVGDKLPFLPGTGTPPKHSHSRPRDGGCALRFGLAKANIHPRNLIEGDHKIVLRDIRGRRDASVNVVQERQPGFRRPAFDEGNIQTNEVVGVAHAGEGLRRKRALGNSKISW